MNNQKLKLKDEINKIVYNSKYKHIITDKIIKFMQKMKIIF